MTSGAERPLEGIAIIGLAGRFPKAPNLEAFWNNVRSGREGISFFSEAELEEAAAGNPRYVKARAVLEQAEWFDAGFFGIQPKEAEIMDPQHRLFLETAWEALENAGYDPEQEPGLIGVFGSMSMNSYLETNLLCQPGLAELVGSYALMLANDKDYLPTRVAYKLNLRGPSMSVQTGCSSALVAVCLACQHLLTYQCDLALAGAVSVSFPQKRGHVYQEGSIYSPDGHCRAFDARAQGTVGGEGVGLVVLKRLAEAVVQGDTIWAVIKGFAVNNDGSQKAGFTAPSEAGQAECIALAQAMAGVEPESIGYVEAHGTGTPLGDPIEVAGLARAFRAGREASGYCALGSVKTHIGHLDAAAGIAGLLSATLALRHRELPPTLHYAQPNPKIDFAHSPFYVNRQLADWPPGRWPRRAGVSSFGIGGTNAHVVLEEAPPADAESRSERGAQLLVLSAKSSSALERATSNLAEYLKQHPQANLGDVAYTLHVGRRAFAHRRVVVCRGPQEAAEALEKLELKRVASGVVDAEAPEVVFMFPGQGAQRVGMGRELYQAEPVFREEVDQCIELLAPILGLNLRQILYPAPSEEGWARAQLGQTQITQPALFVIEYALAKLWQAWGVQPQGMIGHSLGEYVAACLAGVFSLKEALELVAARGRLMQQQPPGQMLAVRLPEDQAQACAERGGVALAAINSPGLCVLSGAPEPMTALARALAERGVASHRLETSHAFHSPMMEPVLEPFLAEVKRVSLKAPRLPYVSNVSGDWIRPEEATDPMYWTGHLRQAVRFGRGLATLLERPGKILLEVGPGQTLSTLARQNPAGGNARLVLSCLHHGQAEQTDRSVMLKALGQLWLTGLPINWKQFHSGEQPRRVPLPTYPFERQRYWVEPRRQPRVPAAEKPVIAMLEPAQSATPATPEEFIPELKMAGSAPESPKEKISAQLKAQLSGLSGLDLAAVEPGKSFTELGFDSLFLSQFSQGIEKQFGVRVPFAQLLDKYSTIELLADHLAQGTAARIETPSTPAPAPGDGQVLQNLPLTEAQTEIWLAMQMGDAAASAFNQSIAIRLRGPLEVSVLSKTIQRLVDRHEALRVTLSAAGDAQQIHSRIPVNVRLDDFSMLPAGTQQTQLQAALAAGARERLDLIHGPPLRAHLIRQGPQEHTLLFTTHHLICDGGSLGVLLEELAEFYTAELKRQPGPAEPQQQFSQFVRQQHAAARSPERAATEAFWLQQYARPAPALELPADRPRPSVRDFSGGRERTRLDAALTQELKRFSTQQRCTLFTTLLAGYYLLLHRLSGQSEVIVGLPMTSRSGEGSRRLVGHCVNFLPLRLSLDANAAFTEHLASVRRLTLEAHEHQQYTFGTLVQKLNLPRNPGRMPLVSVMFNLDWVRGSFEWPGLKAEIAPNPQSYTNFDLSLSLAQHDGDLELQAQYSAELFDAETIQRWLRHYQTLLAGAVAEPSQRIGKLSLLTPAERRQLLEEWSCIRRGGYHQEIPLASLWESARAVADGSDEDLRLYVLDDWLEPCPIGVAGELCLSEPGPVSAPGAMADPFRKAPELRLRRSGRRARYLPDGRLELVTRPEEHIKSPLKDSESARAPAEGPFSPTEKALAQIWSEVLGFAVARRGDNFFELGGHSVLVTRVFSRVRKAFGVELTLRHAFEAPTIGAMAQVIQEQLIRQLQQVPETEAQSLAADLEPVAKG